MQPYGTYGLSQNPNKLMLLQQLYTNAINSSAPSGRFENAYNALFAVISVDSQGQDILSEETAGELLAGENQIDYQYIEDNKFDGGWQPIDNGADDKVDKGAWIFLQGVAGVNAGTANDPYSIFAREYTAFQHKVRFGLSPSADVSDEVQGI